MARNLDRPLNFTSHKFNISQVFLSMEEWTKKDDKEGWVLRKRVRQSKYTDGEL